MFVSVVHVKPEAFEATKDHVRMRHDSNTHPDVSSIPGFREFYAFEDEGWITTVAVFDDESGKDAYWDLCKTAYADVWVNHVKPKPGSVKWTSGHVSYHKSTK